jgi:hypothetical protein
LPVFRTTTGAGAPERFCLAGRKDVLTFDEHGTISMEFRHFPLKKWREVFSSCLLIRGLYFTNGEFYFRFALVIVAPQLHSVNRAQSCRVKMPTGENLLHQTKFIPYWKTVSMPAQ